LETIIGQIKSSQSLESSITHFIPETERVQSASQVQINFGDAAVSRMMISAIAQVSGNRSSSVGCHT
jgi:hypothetical protein